MIRLAGFLVALTSLLLLGSCTTVPTEPSNTHAQEIGCTVDRSVIHENLTGTLWVQTSAEYIASANTTYRNAIRALDDALSDTSRSAALEQTPPYRNKPPAVILDIDETVLDNAPFQAQMVLNGVLFEHALWLEWVSRASAKWVPGALAFLEQAKALQVKIFFVTNRTKGEESHTRRNFERLGYKLPTSEDTLLTKAERDNWTSDKTSRRAFIAENYRVLLIIGDDLNDFTAARVSAIERRTLAQRHRKRFGRDWFLLPNPLYGSWERALSQADTDCGAILQKKSKLKGF